MKHSEALKLIDAAYWRLARACEPTHDVGVAIASGMSATEAEANGRLIVRAVNNHESLLSALKALLDEWNSRTALIESCDLTEAEDKAVAMAELAIQKAEGEL